MVRFALLGPLPRAQPPLPQQRLRRILSRPGADAGLGILASARALQLDFIPVTEERYDLIIPNQFLDTPSISRLLEIVQTGEFKTAVEKLGGYSTRETGVEQEIRKS